MKAYLLFLILSTMFIMLDTKNLNKFRSKKHLLQKNKVSDASTTNENNVSAKIESLLTNYINAYREDDLLDESGQEVLNTPFLDNNSKSLIQKFEDASFRSAHIENIKKLIMSNLLFNLEYPLHYLNEESYITCDKYFMKLYTDRK